VEFPNDENGELFYKLKFCNLNRSLAAIIGDTVVSTPVIRSPLRNRLMISGSFNKKEVQQMIDTLHKDTLTENKP
jgi:preprotein translocase subunit SecD